VRLYIIIAPLARAKRFTRYKTVNQAFFGRTAFTDRFRLAHRLERTIARALPWRCDRDHKKALLPPKAAVCPGKLTLFAIGALQRQNAVLRSATSPTGSLVDRGCASANGRTRDQKLAQFCDQTAKMPSSVTVRKLAAAIAWDQAAVFFGSSD